MIYRLILSLGIVLSLTATTGRAEAVSPDEVRAVVTDHLRRLEAIEPADADTLLPAERQALIDELRRIESDLATIELRHGEGGASGQYRTSVFSRQFSDSVVAQNDDVLRDIRFRTVQQLEEMIDDLNRYRRATTGDPAARRKAVAKARAEMASILEAPEFRVERDRMDEMLEMIQSLLNRFYDWLGISGGRVESFSRHSLRAVLAVSLTLIAVIVGRWLWRRFRSRQPRGTTRSHRLATAVRLSSPETHAQEAARALDEGRFREAIHHAYLMVLSALERRQLVLIDRTRTNWEYHRQLLERQAARPAELFGELNRRYDRKWYGHEPLDEDAARGFARMAQQLVEEVRDETA
ncbi:MAG: DUF4129 domain-containing protein [Planctomycetes bacterium]|nr:DUF4129 domain-containing protein [Planctomycetota bacterium]